MKSLGVLLTVLALVAACLGGEDATLGCRIVAAARQQIGVTKEYDPGYSALKYPGGDVPLRTGVCSDVIVRSLRQVGVDLQKEVHEDMRKNFKTYPQKWGLKAPDKNIDHRRVPNLMRYFERHHIAMSENLTIRDTYRPGDIVAWDLGGGVLHMGIVSDKISGGTPLIIHNIGGGTKEEDILLQYQVIGHYRLRAGIRPSAARDAGLHRDVFPATRRERSKFPATPSLFHPACTGESYIPPGRMLRLYGSQDGRRYGRSRPLREIVEPR